MAFGKLSQEKYPGAHLSQSSLSRVWSVILQPSKKTKLDSMPGGQSYQGNNFAQKSGSQSTVSTCQLTLMARLVDVLDTDTV